MSFSSSKISFVIPCYRSVETIAHVVDEAIASVKGLAEYEVVLVNDSSPDQTLSVLLELAAKNKKIKVVDLARNFGQQGAWMSGFKYASGDYIVILDDDGQCPVADLGKLLEKINQGYDVVFAKYPEKKHGFLRKIATRVNFWFAEILIGKPKDLAITNFCVIKRYVILEVIKYQNPYPYLAGLLLKTTNKIANVEVNHRDRLAGESGYTIRKLIALCLDGFTAFSIKPLRIASLFGLFLTFISFLYCIYLVYIKLTHPEMPVGYSSMMTVLLFVSGSMMLMLGLIGEYIGRIYISLNRSPQYVVRSTFNLEQSESLQVYSDQGERVIK